MAIPLYGFLQGDTIGLLILADYTETIGQLAERLQQAASIRVAPASSFKVLYKDRSLETKQTIAEAGLGPLERFDVVANEA